MEKLPEKWCIKITRENLEFCQKLQEKELGFEQGYDYTIGSYYGPMADRNGWKGSSNTANRTEITFEQFKRLVLGETEQYKLKIGDKVRRKKGSGRNNGIDELVPFVIDSFRSDGWIVYEGGSHKPEYIELVPEEIPQEEVEYWECISIKEVKVNGWACRGYKTGQIYKVKESCDETLIRMFNEDCSDWWNVDKCCFKPSTREAYEAQQRGKATGNEDINDFIYPTKNVNKCSTINTNQNECKNEKVILRRKTYTVPRGKRKTGSKVQAKRLLSPSKSRS